MMLPVSKVISVSRDLCWGNGWVVALDVLAPLPCYARIYATLYKSHEVNWKNKLQIWFSLENLEE